MVSLKAGTTKMACRIVDTDVASPSLFPSLTAALEKAKGPVALVSLILKTSPPRLWEEAHLVVYSAAS
jgi:hypothetical protein